MGEQYSTGTGVPAPEPVLSMLLVFLLSYKGNHNLKTLLLSDSHYQFSYTKQVFFFCTKIWVGVPQHS